ncbi:MAG TPA: lamin tail domain-containing protein [Nannocystis sp.]|jgi:hypothetical protein
MRLERNLLLSLALTAVACGDDGPALLTEASTGDTTGTTTDGSSTIDPTTTPTTDTPTGTDANTEPTTQGPTTDTPETTTGNTTGDTTVGDTSTGTTSGDTTGDTDGTTGTTTGDTTGGTTSGDTTGGTTGGDTEGTTGDTGDTDTMGAVEDEIYEIQNGTIAEATMVTVEGVIVTGIHPGKTGLFVQEPGGGEYSGVWVYVGNMGPDIATLAVGDEVDVSGVTVEFNELTEIDASAGTVTATGVQNLTVDAELLPIDTFSDPVTAEPWEGVFVGILGQPLDLTAVMGTEYTLTEAGSSLVVDDLLYASLMDQIAFPQIGVGATFDAAFGPLNQSGPVYKIAPRTSADLEGYVPPMNPTLGIQAVKAGDLVISEVMYNPTCANDDCEWIEIYNASASAIDLNGLIIQNNQQNKNLQGVINKSVVVQPGSFTILGAETMVTWPYPNPPAAFYGANPPLGNGVNGDQVFLKNNTITIDGMPKWLSQAGKDSGYSFKVAPDKLNSIDNDLLANWCYSTVVFYTNPMMVTEKGSPGAANEAACAVL